MTTPDGGTPPTRALRAVPDDATNLAAKDDAVAAQAHGPEGDDVQHEPESRTAVVVQLRPRGPAYCVRCDRARCGHHGPRYYDPRRLAEGEFTPVTTEAGEAMRQKALAILSPRYKALADRSRREFAFSEIERQHMLALAETIVTLQRMEPVAPLASTGAGGVTFDLT